MSFSNSNSLMNTNDLEKFFNQNPDRHFTRLFSKSNSFNFLEGRANSNFSLFGGNHEIANKSIANQIRKHNYNANPKEKEGSFNENQSFIFESGEKSEKKTRRSRNGGGDFVKSKNEKKPGGKRKIFRKKNVFKSLANRNLKLNMGTGFLQYLDFKRMMALRQKNLSKHHKYNSLLQYIINQNFNFRSFLGWKSMWKDKIYGEAIKKLSQNFFGETFVYSYILFSKIKAEYKSLYYSKIESFRKGSIDPETFGPYTYNHVD